MNIRIQTITLFEARKNRKLMRILYALTLRGISEMRNELNGVCSDELAKRYIICLAKINNKVVGWSLLAPRGLINVNIYDAHFYVAVAYRRKYVGTKLYSCANKMLHEKNKKMRCNSWNENSTKFLIKNKASL